MKSLQQRSLSDALLLLPLLQFFNYEVNYYEAKLVLKPLSADRRWKFIYWPIHGDVQVLSKKKFTYKIFKAPAKLGKMLNH
ncbi:hypothetical protein FCM35_KLT21012 [Carex littledalei]|uniref:DUF7781 domain-containing protein n=1 Tax=Carex littledalei TaxID=544730 RepID=A0A833VTD7_9POAL|nr:hypothetical protein FCM35_KLT21012 [Carex littledalei]